MIVCRFYIVVFVYSWLIWLLGIIFLSGASSTLLVTLGGIGTTVGVLYYWIFVYNKDQKIAYLKRLIKVKGVPIYCWLTAIAFPLLVMILVRIICCCCPSAFYQSI